MTGPVVLTTGTASAGDQSQLLSSSYMLAARRYRSRGQAQHHLDLGGRAIFDASLTLFICAARQVRVIEILPTGKVNVSQKSEEEAAQEKQMATAGMSSKVSTAGMSLLQAALARAGVTAETFATEVSCLCADRAGLGASGTRRCHQCCATALVMHMAALLWPASGHADPMKRLLTECHACTTASRRR